MPSGLVTRLGAEALGALVLVYFGTAAIVSPGTDVLGFSIAFAVALAVAIWIFGATSGGHFNPAVTLAVAIRGGIGWAEAGMYAVAQIVGAFVASLLVWLTYGTAGPAAGLGATRVSIRTDPIVALIVEAIATFVFVLVILTLTTGDRAGNRTTALGIGLTLGLANISLATVTGASLNFARTFGPELALSFADGGDPKWNHIWVYLLGPAIGAAAAAYAFGPLTRRAAR